MIDPSKSAEYPVLLGQGFAANKSAQNNRLLSIRYNWKPKTSPQRQIIIEHDSPRDSYNLIVPEGDAENSTYEGSTTPVTKQPSATCLSLTFDERQSAFILESIHESFNFNLKSAPAKSDIEQLPQIETNGTSISSKELNEHNEPPQPTGDSAPDAQNPYDFRHFLPEAKDGKNHGGVGQTLKAQSRPSIGPAAQSSSGNCNSTSIADPPFMGVSQKQNLPADLKRQNEIKRGKNTPSSRALDAGRTAATPKVSSKQKPAGKPATAQGVGDRLEVRTPSARIEDSSRQLETTPPSHIILDEASELEIDMGSPPAPTRPKHRINPHAFSSNSRGASRATTASISPVPEELRHVSPRENQVKARTKNQDANVNEGLEKARNSETANVKKVDSDAKWTHNEDNDDDDAYALAAEIEAAFEQEDDAADGKMGLGIVNGQQQARHQEEEEEEEEEESEVSEEE